MIRDTKEVNTIALKVGKQAHGNLPYIKIDKGQYIQFNHLPYSFTIDKIEEKHCVYSCGPTPRDYYIYTLYGKSNGNDRIVDLFLGLVNEYTDESDFLNPVASETNIWVVSGKTP